jgi:peptidoglycan-associated lipoprotein
MLQRSFGLTVLSIASAAFMLTACQTTKKAAPVEEQKPVAAAPAAPEAPAQPAKAGPVAGSQDDLAQAAGDKVYFGFDKFDLTPESRAVLDAQAKWLEKYSAVNITVEGHCDERGTREYNLALGDRRANAVKNYLVAQGVAAARVTTVSYGKERPMVLGHDEEAWSKNRRAATMVK